MAWCTPRPHMLLDVPAPVQQHRSSSNALAICQPVPVTTVSPGRAERDDKENREQQKQKQPQTSTRLSSTGKQASLMASAGACHLAGYKFGLAYSDQICCYLQPLVPHSGCQKGLLRVNPGGQLSPTQPLSHSPPVGWEREPEE